MLPVFPLFVIHDDTTKGPFLIGLPDGRLCFPVFESKSDAGKVADSLPLATLLRLGGPSDFLRLTDILEKSDVDTIGLGARLTNVSENPDDGELFIQETLTVIQFALLIRKIIADASHAGEN